MRYLLLLLLGLLTACGSSPPGVRPTAAGGSRADGIVTMASTGTIYNPVSPDWRVGETKAARQCRGWGYRGANSFSGWQEACRVYDLHGRCTATTVTRFYTCDADG